jgi:hypothetical protein
MQRLGEVQLAAHRCLGDRGDGLFGARPGGEHFDDFLLDQRRVDVEHDESLGPPRDAVVLHRDVDARVGGDPRQHRLKLSPDSGWHRYPQLQAGDGVIGDAADEVDVDAERGHFAGDGAEGLGGDRQAEHHDGVRRRIPDDRQVVAGFDLNVEAQRVDGCFDFIAKWLAASDFCGRGHQHAQSQPTADHHLLDI